MCEETNARSVLGYFLFLPGLLAENFGGLVVMSLVIFRFILVWQALSPYVEGEVMIVESVSLQYLRRCFIVII